MSAMPKVRIIAAIEGTSEEKSFVENVSEETKIDALIEVAVRNAGWTERELTFLYAKVLDSETNQYMDITAPLDVATLTHKSSYKLYFKEAKPEPKSITIALTIDGSAIPEFPLEIDPDTPVQEFINQLQMRYSKESSIAVVDAIKIFDPDFEALVDVAKPYDKIAAIIGEKYVISMNVTEVSIDPSNSEINLQDQMGGSQQPRPESPSTLIPSLENLLIDVSPAKERSSQFLPNAADVTTSRTHESVQTSVEANSSQNLSWPPNKAITRRAIVGRDGSLGQLYNANMEHFIDRSLYNAPLPLDAIQVTPYDVMQPIFEYARGGSLGERFDALLIESNLKASILGGLVTMKGHSKYIVDSSISDEDTSVTLIYKITTKFEKIRLDTPNVVSLISKQAVNNTPSATHVVAAIEHEAIVVVTLKCQNQNTDDKTAVEYALKEKLASLMPGVRSQGSFGYNSINTREFQFEIFMDELPIHLGKLQNFDDAVISMRRLPSLLAGLRTNYNMPLSYILLPLTAFKHHLDNINLQLHISYPINENAVDEVVKIFDELERSLRELNLIHCEFQKYAFCVTNDEVEKLSKYLQSIHDYKANLQQHLQRVIIAIRQGIESEKALYRIIDDHNRLGITLSNVHNFINTLLPVREKIYLFADLIDKGVVYIGKDASLNEELRKRRIGECYIFFCAWNNPKDLQGNIWYFKALVKKVKQAHIFVDLDAKPTIQNLQQIPEGNRICLYSEGLYLSQDCYADYLEDQKKCYVKCYQLDRLTDEPEKSTKRVDVDLICPLSLKGEYCSKDVKEWYCADCRERLQYDFKHNFHCECGTAPIDFYEFRCSAPKHGQSFSKFSKKYITSLVDKIEPYKEINIMILGETGVGKTTWINGFANYMAYSTLKEAQSGKQIYLVPSQFSITDSNHRLKKITVGRSKNEATEEGASSTQQPRSYVFNVGKKTIRLIDTPGIGDCRGADVDNQNFASILRYISQFRVLHGICILLKPNNARLNVMFRYCINELLTHLDVSAARNIIFCFTNARGTFYRPGDTMPPLLKFLADLKAKQRVEITADQDRVYCMDNESFRFLCCLHAGEKFTEEELRNFEQSWKQSVKETDRILKHFEHNVKPHEVDRTVTLNEARTLILTLAKPLADIHQIIQDNITAISETSEVIRKLDSKKTDIRSRMMIPKIGLQPKELGYPQTVCTGIDCIETQTLPNTNIQTTIYKTICHDHCYLDNVTPETVPNVELQKCYAMNKSDLKCRNCGCPWDLHMHITFTQEKVEKMVEDPILRQDLQETLSAREKQQVIVNSLNKRVEKYRNEQKRINEICAKFGAFLKSNAIVPYNDAVEEYLKFNINEMKRQSDNAPDSKAQERIKLLEEQLGQYRETKRVLDERLLTGKAKKIKPEDVKRLKKELENFELTGADIKALFDATQTGQHNNFVGSEKYFNKSEYVKKPRKPFIPHDNDYEMVHKMDHEMDHGVDHGMNHGVDHGMDHGMDHGVDHGMDHEMDYEMDHQNQSHSFPQMIRKGIDKIFGTSWSK